MALAVAVLRGCLPARDGGADPVPEAVAEWASLPSGVSAPATGGPASEKPSASAAAATRAPVAIAAMAIPALSRLSRTLIDQN